MNEAKRILIVDDRTDVRDVVAMMLDEFGYDTTAASGGADMRLALANSGRFDLIILDALMPGESSASLAQHAKTLGIPVLFCSGGDKGLALAEETGMPFLQKPFRGSELRQALDRLLGPTDAP